MDQRGRKRGPLYAERGRVREVHRLLRNSAAVLCGIKLAMEKSASSSFSKRSPSTDGIVCAEGQVPMAGVVLHELRSRWAVALF